MKHDGLLVEVLTKTMLLKNGFMVSQPIDPKSRYDLIVDNGERLFRVQVKSSRYRKTKTSGFKVKLSTSVKSMGKKVMQVLYKENEVDMFVVYLPNLDMWYVIPHEKVDGRVEISLNPESGKQVYDVYQDAWHLFNR
jgi:hypothetical protein